VNKATGKTAKSETMEEVKASASQHRKGWKERTQESGCEAEK